MHKIVITIYTDSPNADGITYSFARDLFKRFTGKPRFKTRIVSRVEQTGRRDGRLLPPQVQEQVGE